MAGAKINLRPNQVRELEEFRSLLITLYPGEPMYAEADLRLLVTFAVTRAIDQTAEQIIAHEQRAQDTATGL